jgi:hypothetical protein
MAARKSLDFNQIAFRVVAQATQVTPPISLESAARKKAVKKRKAQAKKISARKAAARKVPAKKAKKAS